MSSPLPISVSMISGPEAPRIAQALESIAGWTSEIVVVLNEDAHDGTEEIARRFGARVYREPWRGHITQKNSSLDKCTQDWVFNLDADEIVTPRLREELHAFFQADASRRAASAYSFPRVSMFCGRWIWHGEWYPDRQIRLWRRGRARWGGIDPHSLLLVDGKTVNLRGLLKHHSADSIDARVRKIFPYSDTFVHQYAARPPRPAVWDLAVHPAWRFLRGYVLKRGFLDGWQGFYLAGHVAYSTMVRYAKLREKQNPSSPPPPQ